MHRIEQASPSFHTRSHTGANIPLCLSTFVVVASTIALVLGVIPNILTVLRLALALAVFALLVPFDYADAPSAHIGVIPVKDAQTGRTYDAMGGAGVSWVLVAAAGVFLAAAVTDALDGFLARRWNAVSVFGRIVDPLADKVLVLGSLAVLAGPGFSYSGPERVQASGLEMWMFLVILSRELLVTGIRSVMEARGISFSASASGKFKMIFQSAAVPVALVVLGLFPVLSWEAGGLQALPGLEFLRLMMLATTLVTALSAFPYIFRALAATKGSRA